VIAWALKQLRKDKAEPKSPAAMPATAAQKSTWDLSGDGAAPISVALFFLGRRYTGRPRSGAWRSVHPGEMWKSIAVLPFANMSERKACYFAEGIQDEILTRWRRSRIPK